MPCNKYPYELPMLPYPYTALEPYIDAETMHYHHDKHFKQYVDNLNKALEPYPRLQKMTLEQLLQNPHVLPKKAHDAIVHNGGGVYNHTLFFENLSPEGEDDRLPGEVMEGMLNRKFGSYDNFKQEFSASALSVFGSGWTYLVITPQNRLKILSLKNQDTPLPMGAKPILLFDVWEHAYYLKYKNMRSEYIEGLWHVIKFPKPMLGKLFLKQ